MKTSYKLQTEPMNCITKIWAWIHITTRKNFSSDQKPSETASGAGAVKFERQFSEQCKDGLNSAVQRKILAEINNQKLMHLSLHNQKNSIKQLWGLTSEWTTSRINRNNPSVLAQRDHMRQYYRVMDGQQLTSKIWPSQNIIFCYLNEHPFGNMILG